ncbi:S26 family signal peptidase [Hyphococcus sp.]|uniref:S26 family signal peptidase n=1 Tax=Hyphococcus sp. TaxID=2038636 RepID=UPI0035C676EE
MRPDAGQVVLALSVLASASLLCAMAVTFPPKFIWNASQSAPVGLYRIENHRPRLDDLVLVAPSKPVADFIASRGYLPAGTPLIKRVAALAGDEICREKEIIFIDGLHVAEARKTDSLGRSMPYWRGCFTLKDNEIFLLNDHPDSLDGRYFGATFLREVIGVAVPLFVEEQGS